MATALPTAEEISAVVRELREKFDAMGTRMDAMLQAQLQAQREAAIRQDAFAARMETFAARQDQHAQRFDRMSEENRPSSTGSSRGFDRMEEQLSVIYEAISHKKAGFGG